mgnify:CR=1 FL=1
MTFEEYGKKMASLVSLKDSEFETIKKDIQEKFMKEYHGEII